VKEDCQSSTKRKIRATPYPWKLTKPAGLEELKGNPSKKEITRFEAMGLSRKKKNWCVCDAGGKGAQGAQGQSVAHIGVVERGDEHKANKTSRTGVSHAKKKKPKIVASTQRSECPSKQLISVIFQNWGAGTPTSSLKEKTMPRPACLKTYAAVYTLTYLRKEDLLKLKTNLY